MSVQRMAGAAGKRASLLRRRQDFSVAAFRDHWAGPHAAIACTMPGIGRYTQNRVNEVLWQPADWARCYEADGIVELEFRDEWAMGEANASDAVRTLLPADEPLFLSAITLCCVPPGARQAWPGMVKVMLAARLADEPAAALQRLDIAIATTGCIGYSIESVVESFHRPTLAFEFEAPHVFATLWFPSVPAARAAFGKASEWHQAASGCLRRGTAWWCDALPIVPAT